MFKVSDLRRREFLRLSAIGVAATQFGIFGTARAQSDEPNPDQNGDITNDNEAIVRQAYHTAEGNVMDVDGWANLYATDGLINLLHAGQEFGGPGETFRGREGLREFLLRYGKGIPDVHRELHRVNVLGDVVAIELSIQGTFTGPFETAAGILQPNGAKLNVPTADFWYLRDGEIARFDCYIMISTLLAQIGATPS